MNYGIGLPVDANQVAAAASNLRTGTNPDYTVEDFLTMYPQFGATRSPNVPNVPTEVVQLYIDLAQETIQQTRWRAAWKLGIGLFVAHFCTKYLSSSVLITIAKTSIGTWTRTNADAFELLCDSFIDYTATLKVGNKITVAGVGDLTIVDIVYDDFGGANDQTKITLHADVPAGNYIVSVDSSVPNPTMTGDDIVVSAATQGIVTTESAGGVSYSMDIASIMEDLPGFADYKSTAFGVQLATLARMHGKGGMGII